MEEVLNSTKVRSDFSQFIDMVIHTKPIAVRRNRDVFWAFSQDITNEILSSFIIAVEFEQEEDGSFSGSLTPMDDIVVYGESLEEMIDDAAIQLIEYAEDYYKNFTRYYNSPNRRSHLPYILNILTQNNIEGVKNLIRG